MENEIVYLSNSIIPSRTANSVHVMKMTEQFSKNFKKVTLVAANDIRYQEKGINDEFEFYNVNKSFNIRYITKNNIPKFRNIIYSFKAGKLVNEYKTDLVYSRDILGCLFALRNGKSALFECHNVPSSKVNRMIFKAIVTHEKFLGLVVISEALKKIMVNEFNEILNKDDILVAHDGSDLERFEKLPSKSSAREQLGITQSEKIIGYIGHLYSGRGIEIIVQLAKLNPDYNFYIIGGNHSDVEANREQCSKENIKNINFLGFLSQSEIMKYWSVFDVLLMPYQNKVSVGKGKLNTVEYMSPLKMFEYLASNVPFISSDIPVLREVLVNRENCLLVNPTNVSQWNSALKELINSSELRKEIIANQKNTVKEYSWAKRAQEISQFIYHKKAQIK